MNGNASNRAGPYRVKSLLIQSVKPFGYSDPTCYPLKRFNNNMQMTRSEARRTEKG